MEKIRDLNDLYIFIDNFKQNKDLGDLDKISLKFQYSDDCLSIFNEYFNTLNNLDDKSYLILTMLKNKLELDFENITIEYCNNMIKILVKFINFENIAKFILNKLFYILWMCILKIQQIDLIKEIVQNINANKFLFMSVAPKIIIKQSKIIIEELKIKQFEQFLKNNLSTNILELINNNVNPDSLYCFKNWIELFDNEKEILFLRNSNWIMFILWNLDNNISIKILRKYLWLVDDNEYKILLYNNIYENIIKLKSENLEDLLCYLIKFLSSDEKFFFDNIEILTKYYYFIIKNLELIGSENNNFFYYLDKFYANLKYINDQEIQNIRSLCANSVHIFIKYFKWDIEIFNTANDKNRKEDIYLDIEQRENNSIFYFNFVEILDFNILYEILIKFLKEQDFNNILNENRVCNSFWIFESVIFMIISSLKVINEYTSSNPKDILNDTQKQFLISLVNFFFKLNINDYFFYLSAFKYLYFIIPYLNDENFYLQIHNYILSFNKRNDSKILKLKFEILHKLCFYYPSLLYQYKDTYYEILLNDKYNLNVIKSLIYFFKQENIENQKNLFVKLISIYANELLVIKNNLNIENSIRLILLNVDFILDIIWKIDKVKEGTNSHYLCNITEELWPILNFFINQFIKEEEIINKICEYFVILIQKIEDLSLNFLNLFYPQIINYFKTYPYGCFLYVIENGIKYLSKNNITYNLINNNYIEIIKASIIQCKSNKFLFNENPNLLNDLYGFQFTCIKYITNIFFLNESLYEFMIITSQILLLKELNIYKSLFYFLLRFYDFLDKHKNIYNDLYKKIRDEFNEKLIFNLTNYLIKEVVNESINNLIFDIFYKITTNFDNAKLILAKLISSLDDKILNKIEKNNMINILKNNEEPNYNINWILNKIFKRIFNFNIKFYKIMD